MTESERPIYKEVLGQELPWLDNVEQAKRPQRLPVVLTHAEVKAVLDRLSGTHRLIDVRTTMIYTHVLNRGGKGVVSPLDNL